MSTPVGFVVVTGALASKLNIVNTGAGAVAASGGFNTAGTVLGVTQTAFGVYEYTRAGTELTKWAKTTGTLLGVAGGLYSASSSLEQLSASIERIRGKIDLVSDGIQGLTAGNKIFTIKSRASHFIECTYLTRIVHTESNS